MKAQDLIDLFRSMEDQRRSHETLWRRVDDLVPPVTRKFVSGTSSNNLDTLRSLAERRTQNSVKQYDSTMRLAATRLAAGIYSLTVPDSEKWHNISTATVDDLETEEEKRWAERYRDVMFFNRYAPQAKFQSAMQMAFLSTVYYGPGYVYVEPTFSPHTVTKYQHVPTDEGYVLKDDFGNVVMFAQRKMLRAAVVAKKGWDVSDKVQGDANDPTRKMHSHEFIKIILQREETGFRKIKSGKNAPWVCYTIEMKERKIVYEEGFESFPVACFFWDGWGDYGTSPCIDYINDQRMLNAMERDILISLQQIVRPPLGIHDNSLQNRPSLNPGAINPGAVSADGKPLMIPLLQGQNPERVAPFMEQRRQHLRDGMYNTLFQSLVENPGQTATEVLTRSNEKAQLLGPVGARMHSGLDMLIERDNEALELRGVFAEGSDLLPPESLMDQEIRPKYTNPMQRLQMASQAEGVMRMMEIDAGRQQLGRPALVKDAEAGNFLAEAFNAPLSLIKSKEELAAEDQASAEQRQEQQAVESTRQLAAASKDALPAAEAAGLVQSE